MNLLYTSSCYSSYQCDQERCFYIDFGKKQVKFSFCQLLSLRHKLQKIDVTSHFQQESNPHGFEIITLCNRQHLFILNTLQVIHLKELLRGTFGMLELNTALVSLVQLD